jgi:hypothetical protein
MAWVYLSDDELSYNLSMLHYKFTWPQAANQYVAWNVKFSPSDGSKPVYKSFSWSGTGSETPLQTIDPLQSNSGKNGTYEVELPNSYDIQIDAFIPHNWVYDPTTNGENVFNGNERSGQNPPLTSTFERSQSETDWKMMERATVFPLAAGADASLENRSFFADTGITRAYVFALAIEDWVADEFGRPFEGSGYVSDFARQESRVGHNGFLGEAKALPDGMHVNITHPSDKVVQAHFTGDENIPLINSPIPSSIKCDITVTIDSSQPGPPMATVTGRHTKFPSFELYINGQTIYTYDALAEGTEPTDLTLRAVVRIDQPPTPLE